MRATLCQYWRPVSDKGECSDCPGRWIVEELSGRREEAEGKVRVGGVGSATSSGGSAGGVSLKWPVSNERATSTADTSPARMRRLAGAGAAPRVVLERRSLRSSANT